MVQTLMTTRTKGRNRKSSVSIFSSKVKCGDCGSWYGPKVWHSNDAYRKVIWQCNHKFDGQKCATPTLTEDEIKELFLRAANQVIDQKEQFIAIYEQVLSRSLDTTAPVSYTHLDVYKRQALYVFPGAGTGIPIKIPEIPFQPALGDHVVKLRVRLA